MAETVSPEEVVLFLAALFGVWHHGRNLLEVRRFCRKTTNAADAILCRRFKRHEAGRVVFKCLLGYGAVLMLLSPVSMAEPVTLFVWRFGLIAAALWFDLDSWLERKERQQIGRLGLGAPCGGER